MPPPPISEWPRHSSLPKVLRSRRGFPALSWYSPFQAFRTAPSFLRTSRHLTQEPPLASDATGIVYPITRPVPLPEFMPFRGFSSTGASALSGLVLPCLFSRLRSVTHQMESLAVITCATTADSSPGLSAPCRFPASRISSRFRKVPLLLSLPPSKSSLHQHCLLALAPGSLSTLSLRPKVFSHRCHRYQVALVRSLLGVQSNFRGLLSAPPGISGSRQRRLLRAFCPLQQLLIPSNRFPQPDVTISPSNQPPGQSSWNSIAFLPGLNAEAFWVSSSGSDPVV
jgi:hypothetical protein